MTTTYPGTLDSFDTRTTGQIIEASHVNDLQDAVEAVEAVLGEEGNNGLCEGRLTLLSGSPIALADQAAKTTVYFTPYKGDRISLYDGSSGWDTLHFTEKSVSVPATTSTPFDVFGYNDSGTLALEALSWTNDTTRATALTTQDGVYVKTGATTRRYLGTCRTTGVSGQTEDSFSKRFLWNYYHRIILPMHVIDSTNHTYTTSSYRAWNNDTSVRVNWVLGVSESYLRFRIGAAVDQQAGEGLGYVGVGVDSAATNSFPQPVYHSTIGGAIFHVVQYVAAGGIGGHYAQIVEYGAATSPDFSIAQLVVEIEG